MNGADSVMWALERNWDMVDAEVPGGLVSPVLDSSVAQDGIHSLLPIPLFATCERTGPPSASDEMGVDFLASQVKSRPRPDSNKVSAAGGSWTVDDGYFVS